MDFAFTEEQEELRSTAREFLAEHSSSEHVRAAMESELGYEPQLWKQLGAELGWTALLIPEQYGGLGLGYADLVALLEVMGESLVCAPFFSSVCLAGNALLVAGNEEQKKELLPALAEGQLRATLALTEPDGRWDADGIQTLARREGRDFLLSGQKSYVLDGHCADGFVVAARSEGTEGESGVSLFWVRGDAEGVQCRRQPTLDQTRRLAQIELQGVRVPSSDLLGEGGAGWPLLHKSLNLAAIALAAEQVGGAQRCLDMAVDYAKERVQFGRPIGSFQAIKHKCADMMVQVEAARSAAYYAGCVAAEDSDELTACASLAQAYASDAYFQCASDNLQIHGGVGFTWEYDVHLHFKRAQFDASFLGDAAHHRELVAQRIGL